MDKKIFPFQMVNPSVELLHAKHSRSGHIIYWTVLVVLITAFASLPFIQVDVNTRSRGMVRSGFENNAVLVAANGEVQQIFIQNNQTVHKGDTLLIINSASVNEQIRYAEDRLEETQLFLRDFEKLAHYSPETSLYLSSSLAQREYNQFMQKQTEYQLRIQYAQHHKERQSQLLESGSIAKIDYDQAVYDLQLAQSGLELVTDQYRRNWAQEKQRYSNEIKELQSQRQRMNEDLKQYVLTASIDGSITQFNGTQTGNFVSVGQKIAEISATDELLVETYVPPSDIGLIKKGMPVQFQVDAFNSNQWGLVTGEVTEVSKDVVIIQDTPVFLVRCSMAQNSLSLSNGYKGNIKKGMTLTTHFSVANRTLYDLLYDTMDDWLDPNQG